MRSSRKILGTLTVVLSGLLSLPGVVSQDQQPARQGALAQNRPDQAAAKPRAGATDTHTVKGILDELSEDERLRFRAAVNEVWHAEEVERRRQAMQEANLAYRRALQQEVQNLDASEKVRSVLLRLIQLRFKSEVKAADGAGRGAPERPGPGAQDQPYTGEDRSIITAARIKAEKTPAVIAAKRNLDGAVTTRQRNLASGEYRQAMRRAMELADPRVKRIFARIDRNPIDQPRPTDRRRPD